ncbi:MAG TPA: tetratricopeptide repeat protein [Cytophagales bacterium]|jgi:tetratricopeptide (TPR) repeat protein
MQKSQVIVLAGSVALCGLLYSFPKVLVSDKDKLPATAPAAQASSAPAEGAHTSALTSDQAASVSRLRSAFAASTEPEKKIKFADSLANAFRSFSQFDSAAFYTEQIALAKPAVDQWLDAGDAYYDAFNFATDAKLAGQMGEKARGYYQKVLAAQPGQLDVKARMAMTYVTSDSPMQGITLLREVLAEDPDNEAALLNLGLLSIRSGQYDKAVERFEQILKKDPGHEQARFYLGISYADMGQADKAKPILEEIKAKTNDPVMRSTAEEYLKKLK